MRRLLACTTLAALAAATASADVLLVAGRGPLEGKVSTDGPAVAVESGGWTVSVPHARALAIRRADGVVLHAADRLEDQALVLETRGKLSDALEAYRGALAATLETARLFDRREAQNRALDGWLQARLEVYARKVHVLCGRLGRPEVAVAALTTIVDDARASGVVRDAARTWRAEQLATLGRFDLAALEDRNLGVVDAWFVLGPFDNERGTGFDQALPPEGAPFDPAASFPGKKVAVSWRPLPVVAPRGEVDLDALMKPDDQALAYAVTYLFAEQAGPVALRLGSDEAAKVWVNRALVHQANARRPYRPDQDTIGVTLAAGWNEVLLKVCDQTGDWRFRLRVAGPAGGPAAGVRVATLAELASKPGHPAGATPEALAAQVLPPGVAALEALCAASGDTGARSEASARVDWRTFLHLGYLRYSSQAADQGKHLDREALLAAVKLRPDFAPLHLLLSHTERTPAEFSVNKEENPRRAALEETLRLDPESLEARVLLAQYYAWDLGSHVRARELLEERFSGGAPEQLEGALLLLDLDDSADLEPLVTDRLAALMEAALGRVQREEARGYPSSLVRRALDRAGQRKDVNAQLALLELLGEVDQSDTWVPRRQAQLWREQGSLESAEMALRQALRIDPFLVGAWGELSELRAVQGDLAGSAEALDQALALCPDDPELVTDRGHLAERMGQQAVADERFERALQLNPNLVELREYLEFRARRSDKATVAFETPWIVDPAPLVAAARSQPLEPRLGTRYLLKQTVTKLNVDGTTSTFTQEVIRIENEAGVREMASYGTVYASDQRIRFQLARIHRKGGGTEDAPVGSSRGAQSGEFQQYLRYGVRLPPLSPGDILEVRFRTDDLQQGFFGDYFGESYALQAEEPLDWVRAVLIAPKTRQLHFHLKQVDEKEHQRKEEGDLQVHVFERKGVKPLEPEPNQPWAKELVPQVQVSTFKDWNAFARWYWNLVKDQQEADDGIKAKVKELVAGATTDEEKIRRIYDYVVTDIRYNASWEFGIHGFKPYNATQIYARKFGDCKDKATLINTMLHEVGIKSYPVLIMGEDGRGREDISLPLMNHFNHCISWVDFGGPNGLFLDGTAEHHPYGSLPTMDYGATVVVVGPTGGAVREIPFRGPEWNQVKEQHKVKLKEDGAAELTTTIEGTGTFGVVLRSMMLTEGRRKEVLEPRIGRIYTGAHVKEVRASNVRDLNTPVRVEIDVDVPAMFRKGNAGALELQEVKSWLFDTLYLGGRGASALAADSARSKDVVLPVQSGVEEVVTYELPQGHTVQSVPNSTKLESPFGRYERTYSLEGGKLVVKRALSMTANRVPVEQYEEFRGWLGKIEQAEAERPLLKKGGLGQ